MNSAGAGVRWKLACRATFAGALALIACRRAPPPSDDAAALPSSSAAASAAPAAVKGSTEPPAAPPADPVSDDTGDGGLEAPSSLRVVCAEPSEIWLGTHELERRACVFRGVVQKIHPVAFGRERAASVTLDEPASPLECALTRLRGEMVKPFENGYASTIILTLPPDLDLPFTPGEAVCGSVRSFARDGSRDFDVDHDAFIARPDGEVLLAYSRWLPRDPSPLPGWTFNLGRRRTFKRPGVDVFDDFDLIVSHGGGSVAVSAEGSALLRARDGEFRIKGSGIRATGKLSENYGVRERTRYGFSMARVVAR